MSELISGKDALIALANGKEVEFFYRDVWDSVGEMIVIDHFTNDKFKFRLKPRTITINGIEVPKPDYIVNTPHDYQGTWEVRIGDMYYLFKSQDNYEKFVATLQSIFK